MDKPITLVEAAELCGLSAATLRRQAGLGKLHAWKAGTGLRGVWMTTEHDLNVYLQGYGRDWWQRERAEKERGK